METRTLTSYIVLGLLGIGGVYVLMTYSYPTNKKKKLSRAEKILQEFQAKSATPKEKLLKICDALVVEMGKGLLKAGEKLKMLPSHVEKLPKPDLKGVFYALDLGGTNFRVLRVVLGGYEGRVLRQEAEQVSIPPELMLGTTEALFDFIADALAGFISREGPEYKPAEGRKRELGFTFSFPVDQTAVNGGTLIKWTKGFNVSGTVGQDVVKVLEAAIARKNIELSVSALVNDTVGTLAGAYYWNDEAMAAVILGTGSNACYIEKADAVKKWEGPKPESESMVINMEWGNFSSPDLPLTDIDVALDVESINPNDMAFEKLISGMYLGEIVRRLLLKMAEDGELFGSPVPEGLKQYGALPTPKMSKMDEDSSEDLSVVGDILSENLKITNSTLEQRKVVHEVCQTVGERGARLAAAGIVGVVKKVDGDNAKAAEICHDSSLHGLQKFRRLVAVDGGLYEHYSKFRKTMISTVSELLDEVSVGLVNIELSKDGSGVGAALLAASHSQYA